MHFLQNMLGLIENESLGDLGGYIYWWIGLNDIENEGEFAWPSGNAADFTNWDTDYNEPYPGKILKQFLKSSHKNDYFRPQQRVQLRPDAVC